MKKILFLANHDAGIYNLRKELIEYLIQEKYQVFISSPYGERIERLKEMGCRYIEADLDRHGKNPFHELQLISYYKKIIKKIEPDIILSYTIKPNIYGALAATACKVPCIVNITGLGEAVTHAGILQKIVIVMYKIAFRKVQTIFVQNEENKKFFLKNRIAVDKLKLLPGSGVNIKEFQYEEYPDYPEESAKFLFVGRITKDKGIEEYIEAAEKIKQIYPHTEFGILGFIDGRYENILKEKDQVIHYYGVQEDVKPFYKEANAIVLPSYHEGMANALLEAASTGRPVLASDIPGCRETFDEGVSGLGFPAKNSDSLFKVLKRFMELSKEERAEMGKRGRKKVKVQFDRNIIVNAYMDEIKKHIKGEKK